jgi:hypothetical protein
MNVVLAIGMPPKALWYLTRGSGAVSLVLLTASVVLGLATSIGVNTVGLPRFVVQGLHRNISLLVTVFIALHVATSIGDGYVPLRWIDTFVPLHSAYRPVWTGLGAVAVDLLIAIVVTSLLRVRLGLRAWRIVHWTSYACWPIAMVHGLGTGSDTRATWMLALDGLCAATVVGMLWWRLAARPPARGVIQLGAAAATVLVPVSILVWMRAGPLHEGWGRSSTAAAATVASDPVAPAASPVAVVAPGYQDSFQGTFSLVDASANQVTVNVNAFLDTTPSLALTVGLQGRRTSQGVIVQAGTVSIGDTTEQHTGAMTTFSNGTIESTLAGADGHQVAAMLVVQFEQASGTVQGSLTIREAGR